MLFAGNHPKFARCDHPIYPSTTTFAGRASSRRRRRAFPALLCSGFHSCDEIKQDEQRVNQHAHDDALRIARTATCELSVNQTAGASP